MHSPIYHFLEILLVVEIQSQKCESCRGLERTVAARLALPGGREGVGAPLIAREALAASGGGGVGPRGAGLASKGHARAQRDDKLVVGRQRDNLDVPG